MERYINNPDKIFKDVKFLIYIFDIQFKDEKTDLNFFKQIVQCLTKYSKKAKIFVLLNKIDLVDVLERKEYI